MKILWNSLAGLILLALAGCASLQVDQPSFAPAKGNESSVNQPQTAVPKLTGNPPETTDLSILPEPTVGSVVITNTTATPIISSDSAAALTPDADLISLAQRARLDLADRLKISVDQIDLDKIVPAKWPYDSVGCPMPVGGIEPNAQGYQILLKTGDQRYMYHTDGKDWIGLCTVKPSNEIRTLP
jgi:hypothetical protein